MGKATAANGAPRPLNAPVDGCVRPRVAQSHWIMKAPVVNGSTVELLLLTADLKQFNQFFTFLHQAGLNCFHLALHQWVPQVC